jgi:hypothetical protein
MKKRWYFAIIPLGLILILFFIRLVSPIQVDDVSSGIHCKEWILEASDIYYVIPQFDGVENGEKWCEEILARDKELALHGITHEYKEFETRRSQEYVNEGIKNFEECFGIFPEKFKAPNLGWSNENNWMKEKFKIQLWMNQLTHKVYHCGDEGKLPNWFIKIF